MATKKGWDNLPTYGSGNARQRENPVFPTETAYDGGKKGIVSPHGSNFAMPVHDTNIMEESLGKHRGGPSGSTTDSMDTNVGRGTV